MLGYKIEFCFAEVLKGCGWRVSEGIEERGVIPSSITILNGTIYLKISTPVEVAGRWPKQGSKRKKVTDHARKKQP